IRDDVLLLKEKILIPIENSQAGSAGSTPVARSKLPTEIQALTLGAPKGRWFANNRIFSRIDSSVRFSTGRNLSAEFGAASSFLRLGWVRIVAGFILWQSNWKVKKFFCVLSWLDALRGLVILVSFCFNSCLYYLQPK